MKKIIFILTILFTISISAQNYNTIVLPKKFSFLKEENSYNLNELTKSFFETEGFKVYYSEDKLPNEVANNRCNSIFADVLENDGLFLSKLSVVLKDCQNNVFFTSQTGSSREKDLSKAYNEALRVALVSMRGNLKFENKHIIKEKEILFETKPITQNNVEVLIERSINTNQLFAIPNATGFKLVDSETKIVFVIQSTTIATSFIAQKGEIQGVFIEKGNGWYFEYYQNNKLISERVEVKF